MKIKPGANFEGLTGKMRTACEIIEKIYNEYDYELVLTSGCDGIHKHQSLHDDGNAGDFRNRHIREELKAIIAQRCRHALGKDFDVIVETDHMLVEHDPKG